MKNVLLQAAIKLNKAYRTKAWWRWTVRTLAVLVVFCTTYVLILPALTMQSQPACGLEEHVHIDECYTDQTVCTLHSHEPACNDQEGVLICSLPEITEHTHTEECTQKVLVCQLIEHIHTKECDQQTQEKETEYTCGLGEHTHSELCADGEACSVPEHSHDAACIVQVEAEADTETPEQWKESYSVVSLTGAYTADVPAIAMTQLGYTESQTNVVLTGETLQGYSRYGAWYGEPYTDWNMLFAGFVLEAAQVKDFPTADDAEAWITLLEQAQRFGTPDNYQPKTGDLIFLGKRVGIVTELMAAAEGLPAQLKVIQGDVNGQVVIESIAVNDEEITGYGIIPESSIIQMLYQGEDYTVTATFPRGINIPETAALAVQEILPGTEEYNTYYQQSVETLMVQNGAETEADLDVSFARFFDITFLVDGEKVEPTAAVDIKIRYTERFKVEDGNAGMVVHFAESGTEVLDADTNNGETDEADTFEFTQHSFSVSGTLVVARAATTATKVKPWEIDNTGNTMYVLYAQIGNQYYALDGNGYPVQITVNGHNLTLPTTNTENLYWTFEDKPNDNTDYLYNPVTNVGTLRFLHPFNNGANNQGVTTANPYDVTLVLNNNNNEDLVTFRVRGANNNYIRYQRANQIATPTTTANQATNFYVAQVGSSTGASYNVWFDGTDGGMMSYYGAANENRPVQAGADGIATVELPETWQSSTKYDYTLRGWYDIYNYKYYPVNPNDNVTPTATISGSTVFYADWIAATYDVGQNNELVVNSLDTNNFITTYVFDYNALFNVLSQRHTGSITAAGHSETWTIVNNGKVPYNNQNTLGFVFVDYDANGEFSYANERDNTNVNQGDAITPGILEEVRRASGQDLLDLLFDPETEVIGKYYAGKGNYLFQYMDSTTENYDGVHDGYYYLDARLNAASYNQSQQRFYLYDYLERTSDSKKDGGVGQYSDFLPFNSPYIFDADQLDPYTDSIRTPGYEYDAKDGGNNHPEYNSLDDANTNYFFGTRTDIEFFLPNDAGTTDEYGNYGNISTRGEHMIFDFHGDDDVWVFIDGELVLDIGGLHGVMFGQVDFSSGTVITGKDGGTTTTQSFRQLLGHNIGEGTHTMTIYYMERGSSQSNCAIYFNIAPRYDLEITKEDIVSAEFLDGAVFTIYNDENMTSPAQLWESEEAHYQDLLDGSIDDAKSSFTVVNGVAKCWGISAGKTYYIYETTPPPGYPESDDMIRITLNNRGTATIETTTLHGPNGVATEGFAVIKQDINETLKIVALTVTNQKEGDHTEVRVEKTWAEGSVDLPQSITVYLTADGVPVGRRATLTESNGWSYTWTGLDKYRDQGIDQEIEYRVQEVLVPGYTTTQGQIQRVENYVDWIRVDQMSDSKTFILVHNGQALTYNGRFGWMDPAEAEKDESLSAQWYVTTDHDGFHLKNGLGYTLTYGSNGFYGTNNDAVELNQVIYYLNSRLVIHDHDVYYQFGTNGSLVSEDGLAFTLYQKEVMTGFLMEIINVPVDEENRTFVEVNKVWSDGADKHQNGSVIIRLYADGKDTGRFVTLSAVNDWADGFYELPYYQEDGVTKVTYTVVEDPIHNYLAQYSDGIQLAGRPITVWRDAGRLEAGKTYMLTVGGNALAVIDGTVTATIRNSSDLNQQWQAVNHRNNIVLMNMGTKTFLARNGSYLYMAQQNSAITVTLSSGRISLNGMFLEIGAGYASGTSNSANASNVTVLSQQQTTGMPGTGYTVTNLYGTYALPVTGGMGILPYTFGGLFLFAAAMMYICIFGRKRQRGGTHNRR